MCQCYDCGTVALGLCQCSAIRKCLFLPSGVTSPRLLGSDIEKLLCIHYIHIISIICGLDLEMIEQVLLWDS